jgi:hypothetical protein
MATNMEINSSAWPDLQQHVPRGAPWWADGQLSSELPTLWLVFSDLHVSKATLQTCLQVLRIVYDEAVARGAGILFLGGYCC